jgi:hypothetical protein
MSISLGPLQFFSKIRRDIRSSRCTTCVVDTGGKWKKSSIGKVFATGSNETSGKFTASVVDTGGTL